MEWIRRFGASGDAAIVIYRELGRQGITAEQIPAITLSIGEGELAAIAGPEMAGHLAAWSYLHADRLAREQGLRAGLAHVLRRAEFRHR